MDDCKPRYLLAGRLIQLDGRRPRPVDCGPTSETDLLKDAANVVKKFAEMCVALVCTCVCVCVPGVLDVDSNPSQGTNPLPFPFPLFLHCACAACIHGSGFKSA